MNAHTAADINVIVFISALDRQIASMQESWLLGLS
jgi:hypothetical protein